MLGYVRGLCGQLLVEMEKAKGERGDSSNPHSRTEGGLKLSSKALNIKPTQTVGNVLNVRSA